MSDSPRWAAAIAVGLLSLICVESAHAKPSADRVERAVVAEVNAIRAAAGTAKLRPAKRLHRVADGHSRTMARTGRLDHGDWDRRVRVVADGRAGETIAMMSGGGRKLARGVVRAWMHSPLHRAILLDPGLRRIGIARRHDGRAWFFTADMAQRLR